MDSVYCFIPDKDECAHNNDTTIYFQKEDLIHVYLQAWTENTYHGQVSFGLGTLDELFRTWQADTVSVFLFDSSTVESFPWNQVVEDYLVLKRYDLTKADLQRIRCQIHYPPTPEMEGIRMYPR